MTSPFGSFNFGNSNNAPPQQQSVHFAAVGRDVFYFLTNHHSEDVIFVVKGEEISAHKVLLGARSEYFRTMLFGDMQEGNADRIVIESGISAKSFRMIINYIYSGQPEASSVAELLDLLPYADMYQLDGLTSLCAKRLVQNLSCGNVITMLRISRGTNSTFLQTQAMAFIIRNSRDRILVECIKSLSTDEDGEMIKDILLHIMMHGSTASSSDSRSTFGAPPAPIPFGG